MTIIRENRCARCGVPIKPDLNLCSVCDRESTKRTHMKQCRACGAKNPEDSSYCTECKAPLSSSSIPPKPPETKQERPSLVGRGAELKVLEDCFQVCYDKKQVGGAIITGDPGMGATTLLKAFAKQLLKRVPPTRIIYVLTNEAEPFSPLRGILLKWMSIPHGLETVHRQMEFTKQVSRALRGQSAANITETTHLLGHLAGIEFPDSPVLRSLQADSSLLDRNLKDALRHFFRAELAEEPGIFLLDKMHRASKDTIRLTIDLLESLGRVPLIVVTAGSHDVKDITDNQSVVRINLEPLDDEPIKRLFRNFMPRLIDPPSELEEAVVGRAAGNPGSLHHLCELLKETGVVDTTTNPWRINSRKMAMANIPVTLIDALKARIKQLDPRDRLVLEHAAIFGEMFWDEAIVSLMRRESKSKDHAAAAQIWIDDSDTLTVSSALNRLVERQFIAQLTDSEIPGCIKYAFAKSGIRNEILAKLDETSRAEGHRLAAEWLSLTEERSGFVFAEAEASHWFAADDNHRTGLACLKAARHARTKHLNQKAVKLFEKGLSFVDQTDRRLLIDAQHDLGSVYELLGQYESAEVCFTKMLRHAWLLVHRGKAGAAMNKIGRLYRARGDGAAARAFLNRAMALFKAARDEKGVAACLGDLGELARRQGSYDRALELVTSALELQRKLGNTPSVAVCLHSLGHIEAARADYTKAEDYLREALTLRQQAGEKGGMAQTLSALAIVLFSRGDIDGAISHWKSALNLAEEVGDRRVVAIVHNNLGEAYRDQGKLDLAMKHFQTCNESVATLDDRLLLAEVSRNMGILAQKMGDLDAAKTHLKRSYELAKEMEGKEKEGLALRALGELESATVWDTSKIDGDDAAETTFTKALTIFKKIGNEFEVARTLHARGNRRLERGDVANAQVDLEDAKEIFQRIESAAGDKVSRTINEIVRTPTRHAHTTDKNRKKDAYSESREKEQGRRNSGKRRRNN